MAAAPDPVSGAVAAPTRLSNAPRARGPFDITTDGERFLVIQEPIGTSAAKPPHVVVAVNPRPRSVNFQR